MHYVIDGYNLLFRLLSGRASLQKKREMIIAALNEKASLLNLQITLVFDSSKGIPPEISRGHSKAIEIIYTNEKQSADDYIFEELSCVHNPAQEVIVSSDLQLAAKCRMLGAKTQSIGVFVAWLLEKEGKKKKRKKLPSFQESKSQFSRLLEIFEKRLQDPSDE